MRLDTIKQVLWWGLLLPLLASSARAAQPEELSDRLSTLANGSPSIGGFLGMSVVQVSTGKVVYRLNDDRLFLPASNLKLLISAVVLEKLKSDYRYTTHVLRETSGDVVLVGSGDPSLSGRQFPYDKNNRSSPPLKAIDDIADQIVGKGVERINGDVVGDDTLYPWDPFPPSWTADDSVNDFGAPVSALSLSGNTIAITLRPASRAGEPASIAFSPALEFLTVENHVITGVRGRPAEIRLRRIPNSNQWRATGVIPIVGGGFTDWIPVSDPALFAATALYDSLIRRSVAIRGRPVARHRAPGDPYFPASGEELAQRISPPIAQMLQTMNKLSDNLYAELFLRQAAHAAGHDGTTVLGAREVGAYLTQVGINAADWHLDDGSGLSRSARVTPRLFTQLLTRMATSENRDTWISLLPVGGEDGTLGKRLCCLTEGRGIRAKTGSLNSVIALSGYADSKTSGLLAFSILLNSYSGRPIEARAWVDKIATALLE